MDFWVVQFCVLFPGFDVFVRGLMFFGWVLYCLISLFLMFCCLFFGVSLLGR